MAGALYCFSNTKHKCEEIWGYLAADGHRVGLLTGDVAQKNVFHCSNNLQMVSPIFSWQLMLRARGLHISDVTHVFNFDLP